MTDWNLVLESFMPTNMKSFETSVESASCNTARIEAGKTPQRQKETLGN